jgi:ORF6N domain
LPDPTPPAEQLPAPAPFVERRIYLIRGQRVMLDADLAELYQVPTKRLNEQVKRNLDRFPADFMFQLNKDEFENWRSQIATSNPAARMGLRRPPYAFTEHGVAMLSAVLGSHRAVQMSILIVRTFVKLREVLATHKDLAQKIEKLEGTQEDHAAVLGIVIKDIQNLGKHVAQEFKKLKEPRRRKPRIGFKVD